MPRHPRVGHGVDVHAFAANGELAGGRPLVLAGTRVPGERGLAGHSDADVVLHAVADALLGAAGLGDLGERFGSDQAARAGADSTALLAEVMADVARAGLTVGNVDATIVAQRPRLGPHREALQASLAAALGVPASRVGLKITSTDRLGAIGRGEGVACQAVALLVPDDQPPR